jgi:hypothetical protein
VILTHERSAGIPRTLSVIADNSLVAGFATDQRPIRASVVEEVCRDMDLQHGQPASPSGPASAADPGAGRTHVLSFAPSPVHTPPEAEASAPAAESHDTASESALDDGVSKRRRFGLF